MEIKNKKARSILVTGSSGCLGNPLAQRLAKEGHKVVGLDVKSPENDPTLFTALTGNVCDGHLINRLFEAHDFDAVVHCGGISGAMVAPNDPYKNCEINIFGTVHLLEAARVHGVTRFIFCSAASAYGNSGSEPIAEDAPLRPVSVYGATKAACDVLVRAYRLQHGLDGVSLRIGGPVYGPGRRTESVIRTMLEAALTGRPLRLPGSGGQRMQYVYDADVVNALHAVLDAETLPLTAYNVSGPGTYSVEEIAAIIKELVLSAQISFEGDGQGLGYERGPLDYTAAERDFGYRPQFDMQRGIAAYLEWMRSRRSS